MKYGIVIAAGLSWACAGGAAEKPNLVIVHTDEHHFKTLGCYRSLMPKEQAFVWGEGVAVETPHIDSLAKAGLLCDRFYTASPVCTPSRASFFSGRYPQNTGAFTNDEPLRDDVVTFAEVLRKNGYKTGYAGKWHLDGGSKPGWSPARHFGFEDNTTMFNRGHWKKLQDTPKGPEVGAKNAKGQPGYALDNADEKSFTTDFLSDKAVAFIRKNKEHPFCFVVSLPDPHGPNSVRKPYSEMFSALKFQKPQYAVATPGAPNPFDVPPAQAKMEKMDAYFGMVKCIDDNVGKIIAALKAAGVYENTIIVFTSDHGDMCGEHGAVNKGIPLEGSAKIPFVLSWPAKLPQGKVIREALNTTDFKPTVLSLMGMPSDAKDEGRDASALFRSGVAPEGWKDVTFSRHAGGRWLMAVTQRYKFIVTDETPCLYDLQKDPLETTNLALQPQHRDTVRAMAKELAGYIERAKEPHGELPELRSVLNWALNEKAAFVAPAQPSGSTSKSGKKKNKKAAEEDE